MVPEATSLFGQNLLRALCFSHAVVEHRGRTALAVRESEGITSDNRGNGFLDGPCVPYFGCSAEWYDHPLRVLIPIPRTAIPEHERAVYIHTLTEYLRHAKPTLLLQGNSHEQRALEDRHLPNTTAETA